MPRNIEIKTRIDSVEAMLSRARALAEDPPQVIEQDDTFFPCAHGRLKLRDFGDGCGELIHYERADAQGPTRSDYICAPTSDPATLRDALSRALGVAGRMRKTRLLLLTGQTRIHLDRVHGLGDFMELEVVLHDGQTDADGAGVAEGLMRALGLADAPRLAGAYMDLLVASAKPPDPAA